jgi:hypothetical protein
VTVASGGVAAAVYLDLEFVRVGRGIAAFSFENTFSPLTDPRDMLVSAVVDRLRAGTTAAG